jgi:hypothetical protein
VHGRRFGHAKKQELIKGLIVIHAKTGGLRVTRSQDVACAVGAKERLDCIFYRRPIGRHTIKNNGLGVCDKLQDGLVVVDGRGGAGSKVGAMLLVSGPLAGVWDRVVCEKNA